MGKMSEMAAEMENDHDDSNELLYALAHDAYKECKLKGVSEDSLWVIRYLCGLDDPDREENRQIETETLNLPF